MKVDYQLRLRPVIRYLEKHFNEPLNLNEVARLANLSPYHFHRTFKAVQGETLAEFLRRLRLQAAASELFYKKVSVTNAALNYGFSSSQSLAKAFRCHFGVAPSAFRECITVGAFSHLAKNSKIGHANSKKGNALNSSSSYTDTQYLTGRINMKTEHFDPSALAYVRVTGPYGEGYEEACDKLWAWASPNGFAKNTCIFIYHDNPEITPAEKCRTDICLMVPDNTQPTAGIEKKPFSGGRYGTLRQTVTDKSQYGPLWEDLMKQITESGMECDDRPCFELYHSYDPQTQVADVSFCMPLKA
ncbi:AraC family transcriptional regulator [Vibrio salinus]|uniref:AraC family transcriptional regulator n=1 Tax=Vibrio salinus TaxID=2899784 RepID=UPI001E5F2FCC|nr:AraC family transcriptional regulator [Vibrio salinus]MCE0492732.1 AraC family transcriptional regulator [Vibrio salinus]